MSIQSERLEIRLEGLRDILTLSHKAQLDLAERQTAILAAILETRREITYREKMGLK